MSAMEMSHYIMDWFAANWISVIVLIIIIWAMVSGTLKLTFTKFFAAKKLKVGMNEIEFHHGEWHRKSDGATVESEAAGEPPPKMMPCDAANCSVRTAVQMHDEKLEKTLDAVNRHAENTEKLVETVSQHTRDIEKVLHVVDKHTQHLDEVWVDQLKLMFYNKDLPVPERLYAGVRYVWWGHNGQVKKDVIELCYKHIDLYRAIVLSNPKYAIKEIEDSL